MPTPSTAQEWIDYINAQAESITEEKVAEAYAGNAAAKATIQAWATEMYAAAIFIMMTSSAVEVEQDMMVELVNQIIDTTQAILLALGIAYMLKKVKKRRNSKKFTQTTVSEAKAIESLGNKIYPIPSRAGDELGEVKEVAFIKQRMDWLMHYITTVMQALILQGKFKGKEFIWVAKRDSNGRMDSKVCVICRSMDGKKSVNGNFIPVIMEMFPKYKPYTSWMGWPHAHPRCRCVAK